MAIPRLTTIADATSVDVAALDAATADLDPPFAVIDLAALATNARAMVQRASGTPIRLASKSVRCRAITQAVLALDGYAGILALTLPEALWLAADCDDVVVAYPTADRAALRELAASPLCLQRVTLMVDSPDQLDLIESTIGSDGPPIRLCLDLDASLRLLRGRIHLGTRRSPLHSVAAVQALVAAIVRRPRFRLVGLMAYEGQIAGVGDNAGSWSHRLGVRGMQARSIREIASRRAAVVAAVREMVELDFVNGGGTGSIESTTAEAAVTEVAAGSGLYAPVLFDGYRGFHHLPAAWFTAAVVRRPAPGMVTTLGGGWVASGAAGPDRLPTPTWPAGLSLTAMEGAGEAQTPLRGGDGMQVGDRVWFRHTKAGELCERVNELHLVLDGEVVDAVPTYRGEGRAFL